MKVHKTIRIKPKLDKQIREIAEREDSSFNKVAEHLMEAGLTKTKETLGVTILNNAVDKILSRHFKTLGDRISRLLARNLIEASTNRILMLQLLGHHLGEDKARAFNELAYRNSIKNMKKPVRELEEVIQNVAGKDTNFD